MNTNHSAYLANPAEYERYLSDPGRAVIYSDLELEELARLLSVGQRVCWSALGEDGIAAGVHHTGVIIDLALKPSEFSHGGLARVLFDDASEPEWMDARGLHPVDTEWPLAYLGRPQQKNIITHPSL